MKKQALRRDMFPKEFVVDLNATKAAKRCGYSKKNARNAGARLMANANIQKAVCELMEKRQERLEITADKWLKVGGGSGRVASPSRFRPPPAVYQKGPG